MADTTEEMIREALREGRYEDAVGIAIRGYGEEVLGFLVKTTRNRTDADEVFSQCCVDLMQGVRGYRGEGTFRAWMYTVATNAFRRHQREPYRRRASGDQIEFEKVEAAMRTATAEYVRTENKEELRRLREGLSAEDQQLLTLRIDKKFSWGEVARILAGEGADASRLRTEEARLRKRFERLKEEFRKGWKRNEGGQS